MKDLIITLPEGDDNVKAEFNTNEETGLSRVTIFNGKTKAQYVGTITEQETLDMIVDILLYTVKF